MKATGIVRRIDNMGRFVIPKEILRTMDLSTGTPMDIFVDGDKIILRKHGPDTWSRKELELALVLAAEKTGADPMDYLELARERGGNEFFENQD